jgi:Predicted drug exporters of the RND superfamily
LAIHLGLPSGASQPAGNTQRQAYDLTTEGFGAGFNGALLIVAQDVSSPADTQQIAGALAKLPDVVKVTPVTTQNGISLIKLIPKSGPGDPATTALVHTIRDDRAAIEGQTGAHILVGGTTASNIDVSAKLSSALPVFLVVVVGLAFILLTFASEPSWCRSRRSWASCSRWPRRSARRSRCSSGAGASTFSASPRRRRSASCRSSCWRSSSACPATTRCSSYRGSRRIHQERRRPPRRATRHRAVGPRGHRGGVIMFSIFVAFMFTNDPTIKASASASPPASSWTPSSWAHAVPAIMAIIGSRIWYHPRWFARHVPDPDIEGQRLDRELAGAELAPASTSARSDRARTATAHGRVP